MELSDAAIEWLVNGEHGVSSMAMFNWLAFGKRRTVGNWHVDFPHDPDDFRRCQLLLRAVPEFQQRRAYVAGLGSVWAAFSMRWDEIAALLEQECPDAYEKYPRGEAPKCYDLIKSIIQGAWPTK